MTQDVYIEHSERYGIEVHVPAIESWDGLEKIAQFFKETFEGRMLTRVEGIDARVWDMMIEGKRIALVHDDLMGNKFFAQSPDSEALVRRLAESLDEALRNP